MQKNHTGKHGEKIASEYLKSLDYEIISENFRIRSGEIDIIAKKNNEITFFEVKTRTSSFALPQEAVNKNKLLKLQKTALYFLNKNRMHDTSWKIEVIALQLHKNGTLKNIDHITNISEV